MENMKGMKIRIQPSPVFKILVESLGASPSAIPWAEQPTALQQKVVDGQENGVTNIPAASLYQPRNTRRSTAMSGACTRTWSTSASGRA